MTQESPLVVVGVDGSDCSRKALGLAVEEARQRKARLRIVAAWSMPVMMYAGGYMAGIDPSTFEHESQSEAKAAVAQAHELAPELEVDSITPNKPAAPALLEAAKDADLLVVGSRGLGGFERLLLGSVSQQVAQHAPCPILIVHAK
jgi:nucleotide-binding universal stress UspA family protein